MANILQATFWNEHKFCIMLQISLKFIAWGPTDSKSAFVQEMAWC